jgi:chromosome segregation ATPase
MSKKTHKHIAINVDDLCNQITDLTAQFAARQSERDELQNALSESYSVRDKLQTGLMEADRELSTVKAQLYDAQSAYSFRHNQALAAAQEVSDLKSALAQEKFQYASFRRDVTALLFYEQFIGGRQNKLVLTRIRNRVLKELVPIPSLSTQLQEDQRTEGFPQPAVLEDVGK